MIHTDTALPITSLLLYTEHLRQPQATSLGSNWRRHDMKLNIVHVLFTPSEESPALYQNPAGLQGGAGTKQGEGFATWAVLPQKAPFHPTSSQILRGRRCRWEYPCSAPGQMISVIEQFRLQQNRAHMCKHTHTTLTCKYSQTQMTSRFSLIIVFLNPWFSCGGGLRTIGDLGGWRGAKDNCGLGIFASWTMRFIFGSHFFFSVLLADPAFWLAGICKHPALQTADLDCAVVSVPETERDATVSSDLIYQEARLFTNSLATTPVELWRTSFAPVYTHSAFTATADLYEEYGLESGIHFLF